MPQTRGGGQGWDVSLCLSASPVLLPMGTPSFLTKTEGVPPKGTVGAEGLNLRAQIAPSSMGGHVGSTLWDCGGFKAPTGA